MVSTHMTAIVSEHVLDIAQDTIQSLGYTCEWQNRSTKCLVVLGSWNAYRKHLLTHCKQSREQTWHECRLPKCNQRNHRSHQEMIEHLDTAHLSRIPLVCPIVGCSSQRLLKASDLPQHLRDYHQDVCAKPPPLAPNLFLPTLRPRVPHMEPPPPLPSGPIYGLTPVRKGLKKQTPRMVPPSPSKRIPRNPRQVPGSSATPAAEDEESEVDMDIEDLEPLCNVPNIQKRRTVIARNDDVKAGKRSHMFFSIPEEKVNQMMVVGRRDESLDKDLARPGPMLDPSVYGERTPPVSIYFPAFKKMVEGLIEKTTNTGKDNNPEAKSPS